MELGDIIASMSFRLNALEKEVIRLSSEVEIMKDVRPIPKYDDGDAEKFLRNLATGKLELASNVDPSDENYASPAMIDAVGEYLKDIARQLNPNQDRRREMYSQGATITKLPTTNGGYLTIKRSADDEINECYFVNDMGDVTEHVDRSAWPYITRRGIVYTPNRPTGDDPDHKADDVAMNDDK